MSSPHTQDTQQLSQTKFRSKFLAKYIIMIHNITNLRRYTSSPNTHDTQYHKPTSTQFFATYTYMIHNIVTPHSRKFEAVAIKRQHTTLAYNWLCTACGCIPAGKNSTGCYKMINESYITPTHLSASTIQLL